MLKRPFPAWGIVNWMMAGLFVAALGIGVYARVAILSRQTIIEHDEGISYLAATGHQGEYARLQTAGAEPFRTWATGRDWKHFIQVDDTLIFGRIARDLGNHDIHPPFYFWLLHVWLLLFGVNTTGGLLLNIVFDLVTAGVLLSFAQAILLDWRAALAVVIVWILSPVSIHTALIVRQYSLFALCALAFAYGLYAFLYEAGPLSLRRIGLLSLVAAMGLLVHFYFAIVIGVGGIALGLRYMFRERRRLAIFVGCVLVAGAIFVALFPEFRAALSRAREQSQGYDLSREELGERSERLATSVMTFLVDEPYITTNYVKRRWALLAGMVLTPVALIGAQLWARRTNWRQLLGNPALFADMYILVFALAILGILSAFYLLTLSPRHAMEERYMSLAWVFCAFLPILLIRLPILKRVQPGLFLLFCGGMIVSGLLTTTRELDLRDHMRVGPDWLDGTENVLIDVEARGYVLPLVMLLEEDNRVFVALPSYLIEQPDAWLPGLASRATWYLGQRGEIVDYLRSQGYTLTLVRRLWRAMYYATP